MFSGMDAISSTLAPNSGVAFFVLKPFHDRDAHGRSMQAIMADARKATADLTEARIFVVPRRSSRGSAATRLRDIG